MPAFPDTVAVWLSPDAPSYPITHPSSFPSFFSLQLCHTRVGWTIRELSVADQAPVIGFLETHAASMTAEAVRSATKKMAAATKNRFLRVAATRL